MSASIEAYSIRELANAKGIQNLYKGKDALYTVDYIEEGDKFRSLSIFDDMQVAIDVYTNTANVHHGECNLYKCYYDAQHKQLNKLLKLR